LKNCVVESKFVTENIQLVVSFLLKKKKLVVSFGVPYNYDVYLNLKENVKSKVAQIKNQPKVAVILAVKFRIIFII